MLKDELLSWAEWNSPKLYSEYIFEEEHNVGTGLLKQILIERYKIEPLYIIGLHPDVLSKLGVKYKLSVGSDLIHRFIKIIDGTFFYSVYL